MSKPSLIDVVMKSDTSVGIEATIQVCNDLIMIHASNICAQWPINTTGVQLTHQGKDIIKLGMYSVNSLSYQSFYFDAEYHDMIHEFFKFYRFPMHKPINDETIKNL